MANSNFENSETPRQGGKTLLYYTAWNPYHLPDYDVRGVPHVVATYSDGSKSVWHLGERGYWAARKKALIQREQIASKDYGFLEN